MIEIDGATGGGQVLRSALSLSMVTGEPFRIVDIRGGREDPGLRPQHLAGVNLAGRLCDATVEGDAQGSTSLSFAPGPLTGADLDVDIGTAGSVTLLFDIVLPIAGYDGLEPVVVTAAGGTDVKWSPTFAYFSRVKLPLLRRWGFDASTSIAGTGFYPVGGGEATLRIHPSEPTPTDLVERGPIDVVEVYSKCSASLADRNVAERQAQAAADRLRGNDLPVRIASVEVVESASPGSSILLCGRYHRSVGGVDNLGERGRSAETIGEQAANRLLAFHHGPGAVDPYLADQILLPLALAGGEVVIPAITDHVRSNRDVIVAFGFDITVEENADGSAVVSAQP